MEGEWRIVVIVCKEVKGGGGRQKRIHGIRVTVQASIPFCVLRKEKCFHVRLTSSTSTAGLAFVNTSLNPCTNTPCCSDELSATPTVFPRERTVKRTDVAWGIKEEGTVEMSATGGEVVFFGGWGVGGLQQTRIRSRLEMSLR